MDPCAVRRAALSNTMAHRTHTCLDVAEPATDLLVPGELPVLPLVLLHPVLRAVDDWRFLDDRTGLAARSELGDRGGGIRVVGSPYLCGARQQGRFAFVFNGDIVKALPPPLTSLFADVISAFLAANHGWTLLPPA